MKCNNCGNEIENGSNFCPYCGARLSDDSVNRQQSVYVGNTSNGQIQQPIGKTQYNQMPNKAPASKGKEKTLLIVLAIIVFVIFASVAGFIGIKVIKVISEGAGLGSSNESSYAVSDNIGTEETESDDVANNTAENGNNGTGQAGQNMASVNGIICNSAGAINEQFKGKQEYEFYTDPEGKVGVIFVDGEVYLIDSSLNATLIDKSCVAVAMNYSGEYIFIAASGESNLGSGLCVYDVEKNEYSRIKECNITESFCLAVSPDGNTALVSRSDGVFIMGLDGTDEKIYEPNDYPYHVLGVSNDRSVAYFYTHNGYGLFCLKEGEVTQIYDSPFYGSVAFTSDCKKMLFKATTEGLYYFDPATMSEAKVVLSFDTISARFKGKEFVFADTKLTYYPDAESFEGMYITAEKYSFWLNADIEAVCREDYRANACSRQELKVYDIHDGVIYAITYKDGEAHREEIYKDDSRAYDFTVSDDESILWIVADDKVIMYKDGAVVKEVLNIDGDGFSVGCIKNDPLSNNIYCFSDNGKVFMIDEKGDTSELGTLDGEFYFHEEYSHGKEFAVAIGGESDNEYVYLLFGRLIKKD
ncbi:MAG: zinc ribbon domain-containing protein [Butyrivibrio sp.]|nr:zinc ribbon domain-containing protein [Butyrivibrio sp.]